LWWNFTLLVLRSHGSLLLGCWDDTFLLFERIQPLGSPNLGDYQIVKSTQRDRNSGALNSASSLVGK
jgi:hypothetical protein